MTSRQPAPYGSWRSPITSDLIVAQTISLQDVLLDGPNVYWVEGRPQEGGRYVLVGRDQDGTSRDINPQPLNARTRVHEYGGAGAVVSGGVAFLSNFADQRLYRIAPGEKPAALTPAPPDPDKPDSSLRFADGRIDGAGKLWIGVRQDHLRSVQDPHNTIVALDLPGGGPGTVVVQGNDFYSNPRLSPDGKRLAWLTWNHPNMPWVSSEVWVGDFTGKDVRRAKKVAGGPSESVFQPEWTPDGQLYFVSDRSGWWNLYRAEANGSAIAVCRRKAEFGLPQWYFGLSLYAFLSDREAICTYADVGLGRLARLDLNSGILKPFDLPFTEYGAIRAFGGKVAFRAGSPTSPPAVVLLDPGTGATTILRTAGGDDPAIKKYLSVPRPIEFPSSAGRKAFALYYPPQSPDFTGPDGELPPLVVKCHGGPTAAASSTLDLRIQFWTSRGVAVVDVDYGGSTGYGREYRDLLHLDWGVVDVQDCAAAVRYLADSKMADPARAIITGGSAGGFTTLACLTARDPTIRKVFCSGASHYGVSDLEALVRDTHKFESRYLDWLIGPYPKEQARYVELSPVHHAGELAVPVAFFQGDEDKIVPPSQTELMVETLRRKGIPVLYLLFSGEQHGFRQAANIKRALDAELFFYAVEAFRIELTF
jgi:dipeptidyl aminopeptidase/acylaminoacyl peptidase